MQSVSLTAHALLGGRKDGSQSALLAFKVCIYSGADRQNKVKTTLMNSRLFRQLRVWGQAVTAACLRSGPVPGPSLLQETRTRLQVCLYS